MNKLKSIIIVIVILSASSMYGQLIIDAVKKNEIDSVKAIIKVDIQAVNCKDTSQFTPLHWAAFVRNSAITRLLLENGADLSPKNKKGDTPLNIAISRGSKEIINLLLDHGAEYDATGEKAKNVLQLSARFGLERLFKIAVAKGGNILFENSATNNDIMRAAVLGGSTELVKFMIDKGVDVNVISKYRGKPLDLAYENDNNEMIEFLKLQGATYTPLQFETKRLSNDIIRITFPWGMRNNMIGICGPEGQMLIETGFSKRAVEAIKETINNFGNGTIRYIVNTHSHWDHSAGNNGLARSNDSIIGLKKIIDGSFQNIITKTKKLWVGPSRLNFESSYVMNFNHQEIFFFPYPGLHSEEDLLIYFPKSKVLCLGDLLLSQSCPAIRNVSAYMDFLTKVIDIFPEGCVFVSGHGKDLTHSGLKKYHEDLQMMNEIIKKEYQSGKSLEEMISADILGKFKNDYTQLDWLGPDFWIRNVCSNLESGTLK